MFTETVTLFPQKPDVTLTAYISKVDDELTYNQRRKAMLIIPGGGYHFCSSREGEPIAHAYLALGFNTFVLEYSVAGKGDPTWPNPLIDASAAMKYIRDHAEDYHIDPNAVYIVGFSAGGHLAAALGTLWDDDEIEALLQMPKGYNKPSGMVLAYPVISGGVYAHRGSFDNILGAQKDSEEARAALSLETCVSEKTCPAFLWTTRPDTCVPVQNTLLFGKALADAGVPFEMHIYPNGGHGASLGNAIVGRGLTTIQSWVRDSVRWIESLQPKE